jgi:hypothetical protein
MRKLVVGAAVVALTVGLGIGCNGTKSPPPPPPGPVLQLDRIQLNFGEDFNQAVRLGTQPLDTLQLLSQGAQAVQISNVQVVKDPNSSHDDSAAFTASGPDTNPIPSLGQAFITVVFNPTEARRYSALLTFTSNDPSKANVSVPLNADVVAPAIGLKNGQDLTINVSISTILIGLPDGGTITTYGPVAGALGVNLVNNGSDTLVMAGPNGTTDGALTCSQTEGPDGNNNPGSCNANPKRLGDGGFDPNTYNEANAFSASGPDPTHLDRLDYDGGTGFYPDDGGQESSLIEVAFKPSLPGTYSATINLNNNDPKLDGGPFVITVTGIAADDGGVYAPDGGLIH